MRTLVRRPIPRLLWFRVVGMGLLTAGLLGFWLACRFLKQSDWYYGFFFLAAGVAGVGSCGGVWLWGNWMQKAAQCPTPWLDRRAWAKGEIAAAENATSAFGLGSIGILAAGVALVLFVFGSALQAQPALQWVALLFGVAFSSAALYTGRFRRKFGKSFFRLSTLPGVVGGTLEGTLRIGASFPRNTRFEMQLQCLKQERPADENDGRSVAKVIWQTQQVVYGASGDTPDSSQVPLKFEIPSTCPESADPLSCSKQVVWQLTVTAPTSGLSYAANFEVPVYQVRACRSSQAAVARSEANPEVPL